MKLISFEVKGASKLRCASEIFIDRGCKMSREINAIFGFEKIKQIIMVIFLALFSCCGLKS